MSISTSSQRLKLITDLDKEFNRIQDLDLLLEHILKRARETVNADAGSIYIKEEDLLVIRYSQNDSLSRKLKPGQKLIYSFFRIPVNEETLSGYAALHKTPLNVRDMYKISKSKPYRFNPAFDNISGYRSKSSLTLPLVSNQGEVFGVLQLINARNNEGEIIPFRKKDEPFIMHFASTATMAIQRARMTRALLLRMIQMAELRDPKETGAHVNRVGAFSMEIYEAWAKNRGIPETEIIDNKDTLRMAAMLHDVGKVGISDLILKKPGRFTDDEYSIMKQHTIIGGQLFGKRESHLDQVAYEVALYHHESWDGSGYPGKVDPEADINQPQPVAEGFKGEEIPLFARIVSLADVYDALCSKRIYKEAWDEEEAINEIKQLRGRKFDPEIVDAFIAILPVIRHIQKRYPEETAEKKGVLQNAGLSPAS